MVGSPFYNTPLLRYKMVNEPKPCNVSQFIGHHCGRFSFRFRSRYGSTSGATIWPARACANLHVHVYDGGACLCPSSHFYSASSSNYDRRNQMSGLSVCPSVPLDSIRKPRQRRLYKTAATGSSQITGGHVGSREFRKYYAVRLRPRIKISAVPGHHGFGDRQKVSTR